MVLGVCGRLLHDPHLTDDAFQATFLALARRASSISTRASVSSWLYKVAYRVALQAKAQLVNRTTRETALQDVSTPAAVAVLGLGGLGHLAVQYAAKMGTF
jgi:RNA polymerase sigma-70 factor (ECF subfamily)